MSGTTTATPQERLRALAATATIGTDRFGGDTAAVDTLLTEAATCGLRARAGWRPRVHAASLEPCPPDERPVAPPPAIARLHMLLAERDAGLIEEWATLAVSHSMRVDGATAPLLLDWWAGRAKRPSAVFAALGRLGEWLASLNPDWDPSPQPSPRKRGEGERTHTLAPEGGEGRVRGPASGTGIPADAETLWQTGTIAERIALLTSVRRLDPSRALALVASTWQDDAAAERQKFVEVLQEHASIGDEPFLEAALDDRSKIVRRHVAAVLVRVPGSRWRQRMSAAARQFISIEPGRQRDSASTMDAPRGSPRAAIRLRPPEAFDSAWERDGLEEQPPKGAGQRAWWMYQILAGADLAIWTEQTGLAPAAVLEALQGDDFAVEAVRALIVAARLARDPDWSAALARHLLRQPPVEIAMIVPLLEALPGADAERLALEMAAADSLATIDRWEAVANSRGAQKPRGGSIVDAPTTWSLDFSRDVMTTLSHYTSNQPSDLWRASQLLEITSRRLDPGALDLFERAATRSFALLKQDTLARHVDRVRVRAEMRKEFSS